MKNLHKILAALPLLLLVVTFIFMSAAGSLHGKLLGYGESRWEGYGTLRQEPTAPTCDTESMPSGEDSSELDALFGEEEDAADEQALAAAAELCKRRFAEYHRIVEARKEASLLRFASLELGMAKMVQGWTNYGRHFLVILLIVAMLTATLTRRHLSLRSPSSRRSERVSLIAQSVGNATVAGSFIVFALGEKQAGTESMALSILWIVCWTSLTLASLFLLTRPAEEEAPGSVVKDLLSIPLYTYMAILSSLYFFAAERHFPGLAIYISQITEHAVLYINVALYVFAGMLLKNTDIANRFFAMIRPWRLSPQLLIFVIILASALPTAYSGASGIFVIAAGAIIYHELRNAGIRRSMAQAATAMSGSMGIVLNPCLLVVIIAALNKDVTTDQLFGAGVWLFGLNIAVFAVVLFLSVPSKLHMSVNAASAKESLDAFIAFVPYIVLAVLVLLLFRFGFDTPFDEYSAAVQLPFILLVLVLYDRLKARRDFARGILAAQGTAQSDPSLSHGDSPTLSLEAEKKPVGISGALLNASGETSINSGALLSLMALSICVGGIIERANLHLLLPQDFFSPFAAMALLFVILVFIGMVMDPYGAVILVSGGLTGIAYANGISPVHFWLVVLSAFELGYLTPPVALNHLLTRQIIGEKEYVPEENTSFYRRHERILFPIAVKGTVLILIAFVPLLFNKML